MLAQGPASPVSPKKPSRTVGSRRIFPALFKLQVLDAYRLDHECKGNQRATARKFNVHRRQIQKWLQCETSLRASVADALRYDAGQAAGSPTGQAHPPEGRLDDVRLQDPGSRVYKHDARTLKLVAQKLYPSFNGAMQHKESEKGEMTHSPVQCFVPKEYQLNDTRHGPIVPPGYKLSMDPSAPRLILKENGLKMCGSETLAGTNFSPCNVTRPQPVFTTPVCPPYSEEPYNLVVNPVARPPTPEVTSAATSPLPARVAEIVADSKTSAFSPKRKWLQDCMQEQEQPLPLVTAKKAAETCPDEPVAKKPRHDFSIARLCGSSSSPMPKEVKTEVLTPPPPYVTSRYQVPPPLVFPPPLLMPHRTIPELMTLHFKPDPYPYAKEEEQMQIKQESLSDDDDDIDVTSTTPSEDKSFEFPLGFHNAKRRSFSVQFKLNVLDAFYNDKECNQNQRATARKFNINRRQVQKWLSVEGDLRFEGRSPPCAQCPHHCTPLQPPPIHCQCSGLSALPPSQYQLPHTHWLIQPAIY